MDPFNKEYRSMFEDADGDGAAQMPPIPGMEHKPDSAPLPPPKKDKFLEGYGRLIEKGSRLEEVKKDPANKPTELDKDYDKVMKDQPDREDPETFVCKYCQTPFIDKEVLKVHEKEVHAGKHEEEMKPTVKGDGSTKESKMKKIVTEDLKKEVKFTHELLLDPEAPWRKAYKDKKEWVVLVAMEGQPKLIRISDDTPLDTREIPEAPDIGEEPEPMEPSVDGTPPALAPSAEGPVQEPPEAKKESIEGKPDVKKISEAAVKIIRCKHCKHYWYATDPKDMEKCQLCMDTDLEKSDAKLFEGEVPEKINKAMDIVEAGGDADTLARELLGM